MPFNTALVCVERATTVFREYALFLHEGNSPDIIKKFPDHYFDFIYIDGDHSYAGVKQDIGAARQKVKESGYLISNDYTFWSPAECLSYGVIHAVDAFCVKENWGIVYFALDPYMYCDVALRRKKH